MRRGKKHLGGVKNVNLGHLPGDPQNWAGTVSPFKLIETVISNKGRLGMSGYATATHVALKDTHHILHGRTEGWGGRPTSTNNVLQE